MLRNLNDYESMLATSTCNVALRLKIPIHVESSSSSPADETTRVHSLVKAYLRQAWSRCVSERTLLQVRLVKRVDENCVGPLGQRYGLSPVEEDAMDKLFTVDLRECKRRLDVVKELQAMGTTALDVSQGTYVVACHVEKPEADADKALVAIFLSLCHALSDGPGALRIARSFLVHLGDIIDGKEEENTSSSGSPQPLTDLQALLIGKDYKNRLLRGSSEKPNALFDGMDDILAALISTSSTQPTVNGMALLPPEAMQNLPTDPGFGGPSVIDVMHFSITAEETESLRRNCRDHGATVQGALTAAALVSRVKLLDLPLPVYAAVQVPVDTRSLPMEAPPIDLGDTCLCGSAGVWHTAEVLEGKSLFALARRSTELVRRELTTGAQPKEWLYRLMNNPTTLPPYSLMVSSIGITPIEVLYGRVDVERVLFFGGSLRTQAPSKAQATMVHAVTFAGELNCMINFVSPGVSRNFVEETANRMKSALVSMARGEEAS
jgi:hypothetical protein